MPLRKTESDRSNTYLDRKSHAYRQRRIREGERELEQLDRAEQRLQHLRRRIIESRKAKKPIYINRSRLWLLNDTPFEGPPRGMLFFSTDRRINRAEIPPQYFSQVLTNITTIIDFYRNLRPDVRKRLFAARRVYRKKLSLRLKLGRLVKKGWRKYRARRAH